MSFKRAIAGVLTIGFMIASATSLPSPSYAQDAKVKTAMDTLQSKAEKLGPAKVEGTDTVSGKQVPAIYFGSTKQNNNFALVDDVANETGGIATIFVKSGDGFVRVATNLKRNDGNPAVGTILDPKGKAIESIKKNQAFYGDVDILGKPYSGGYEPIRDAGQNVIGSYFVGYPK